MMCPQAHLQSVHGTDRLYACDSCEFVTANKGAMMGHLTKHIPTTTTTATTSQFLPTAITAPPSTTTVAATPLYACTQCGFTTPTMSTLVAHAASHNIGRGANSNAGSVAAKTPQQSQPQQRQVRTAQINIAVAVT